MLKQKLIIIAAIEDVKDTSDEPIVLLQKLIEVFGGDASSHTFGDLLLSLSELSAGDIKQIKDFIAEEVTVDTSLFPLDSFLENDKPEHDTHCHNLDEQWKKFVKELDATSFGQLNIKELSKPSGPSQAKIFILWNCPSYKTLHSLGSHTLDPTNPCVLLQVQKIGMDPSVLTADMIPIRKDHDLNIPWERLYQGWPDIKRLCLQFNMNLAKKNRFILVLGQENFTAVKAYLDADKSITAVRVNILLEPAVSIYKDPAHFLVIKESTGKIRQIIFFSYHLEFFLHGEYKKIGLYHDLIWNAACDFARVGLIKDDLFTWKFTYHRAVELAQQEKERELSMQKSAPHQIIPLSDLRKKFLQILRENPKLADQLKRTPRGESYISQILVACQERLRTKWEDPNFSWSKWGHNKHVAPQKASGRFGGKETKTPGSDWWLTLSGQANKNALDRNHQAHRDKATCKWKALMATYDVRSLLRKVEEDLSFKERAAKDRIMRLKEEGENEQRSGKDFSNTLRKLATFYDMKKWPNGLRFQGDGGGPMPDPDPYKECPHPAVSLFCGLNRPCRKRFV